MKSLYRVNVVFTAGAEVERAAEIITHMADNYGLRVRGEFNGTAMLANPGDTVKQVLDLWQTAFYARQRQFDAITENARLDRIERKLDWFYNVTINEPLRAGLRELWPGDTPTIPERTE